MADKSKEGSGLEKGYLNQREAAAVIGMSPTTLATWRSRGTGPVFYRFNRKVLYKREDLAKWVGKHYECVKPGK